MKSVDNDLKERLINKAKAIYKNENTGHDFSHIQRVLDYCNKIQKEENADWDIIFVSALFHDVHRVMSNRKGKFVSASESIDEVKKILSEFDFDERFLSNVLYIIEKHDCKELDSNKITKELQIVQDADILDAIGLKGLERTLKFCKTRHIPITNLNYPLDSDEYVPNTNPISTTHYITRTMIPQIAYIHTECAKELAKKQVKILKDFVDKSIKEHNVSNYDLDS